MNQSGKHRISRTNLAISRYAIHQQTHSRQRVRESSATHELEADRLGFTLLVSDSAALRAFHPIMTGPHRLESHSDE
jgi:hypothetical protein